MTTVTMMRSDQLKANDQRTTNIARTEPAITEQTMRNASVIPITIIIEAAVKKLAEVVRKYLEGAGSVSPI